MINLYIFNECGRGSVFGIGTYIHELIQILPKDMFCIHIIYLNADKEEIIFEEKERIHYWYFPTHLYRYQQNHPFYDRYYYNIVYILRLHIQEKENIIFHLNHNSNKVLAEQLKAKFNAKLIITVHFFYWCFELFGNFTRFQTLLSSNAVSNNYRFAEEQALMNLTDGIICLSQFSYRMLVDIYQTSSHISMIPNGLSELMPIGHMNKNMMKKKYQLSQKSFVILFVGRLDPIKGLEYAIRAFANLRKHIPDVHLVIAGNGNFEPYFKDCGNDWMNIHFTGLLTKEQLYELYVLADIGVMPSFHEQCSFVAIEMMMFALPIIGFTTTGLKEMIIDGETGFHIPVIEHAEKVEIDTSLFGEKMLYLLQHPKERKRMGANARRRYNTEYTAKIFTERMLKFYKSLFDDASSLSKNKIIGNSINEPLLSVVMPVYNGQLYIGHAIDSILQQTMGDFELIIIDDASTDDTLTIINSYHDKRIKTYRNQDNLGNYPSRNIGMKNAVGKYIAVMDADDICMMNRFEKQVQFMELNKEVGIAASAVRLSTGKEIFYPSDTNVLKVLFFQENYLKHPSLIFRNEMFEKYHLRYDEQYRYSADYDLLVRAFRYFPVTTMREVLLTYRIHPNQITSEHRPSQWEFANQIRIHQLHHLNIQPTVDEIEIHLSLLQKKKPVKTYQNEDYIGWIEKLISQNNHLLYFHQSIFSEFLYNLLNRIIITNHHK